MAWVHSARGRSWSMTITRGVYPGDSPSERPANGVRTAHNRQVENEDDGVALEPNAQPCPFCGHDHPITRTIWFRGYRAHALTCSKCGAIGPHTGPTENETAATRRWNARLWLN
ncbi:MAG: Lar family restriction alleviation protein [Bryobacteraceae bacterium]